MFNTTAEFMIVIVVVWILIVVATYLYEHRDQS